MDASHPFLKIEQPKPHKAPRSPLLSDSLFQHLKNVSKQVQKPRYLNIKPPPKPATTFLHIKSSHRVETKPYKLLKIPQTQENITIATEKEPIETTKFSLKSIEKPVEIEPKRPKEDVKHTSFVVEVAPPKHDPPPLDPLYYLDKGSAYSRSKWVAKAFAAEPKPKLHHLQFY